MCFLKRDKREGKKEDIPRITCFPSSCQNNKENGSSCDFIYIYMYINIHFCVCVYVEFRYTYTYIFFSGKLIYKCREVVLRRFMSHLLLLFISFIFL